MKDYSQNGEQAHILAAMEGRTPARLLDIGAYNPTELSNSRALIELGWKAVLVEPSPGPMYALLKEYGNHPDIVLIQAAVSLEPGLVKMHITDDALSTYVEREYEKWKDAARFLGSIYIPVVTPQEIGHQFAGFDFINIDAEGISVDLFRSMIVTLRWRPRCLCVEIDGRAGELMAVAENAGYASMNDTRFGILGNGTNVVLVRK